MRNRLSSPDDLACYGDHLRDEAKDTAHVEAMNAQRDAWHDREEAKELQRNLPIARKMIVDTYRDDHGTDPGPDVDVEAQALALARSWAS